MKKLLFITIYSVLTSFEAAASNTWVVNSDGDIIFLNPIPPDIERELFVRVDKSIPLYVPAESVEKYKAAEGWNEFKNIMAIPSKL
ncbi:MAG: hypothetical protein J6Q59_04340 [Paludibacteraceae bacterium]|nr:hypothetical protein [Paludibacteraceae bacterium]